MMNNLYYSDHFDTKTFASKEEWLKNRIIGIGGSEASALLDKSRYKTNSQLWREKQNKVAPKDLSNNKQVDFGSKAEEHIRNLFLLDHRDDYEVQYMENTSLRSKENDFMFYSPDGLLLNKSTDKKGILEIKTSLIHGNYEEWKGKIPTEYYIQVLHGLLVTKYDFVVLKARLKFIKNKEIMIISREYIIQREEVSNDLKWLEKEEVKRWNAYYVNPVQPPLVVEI